MNKKILISIFVIVALAQLYVPVSMIVKSEFVLEKAELYKFKTSPVDPYDAFRGKYVALGIDRSRRTMINKEGFKRGQKVYALIVTGEDGFSNFGDCSARPPKSGAYLKVNVMQTFEKSNKFRIESPFNRYYMNEELAPKAEDVYRHNSVVGRQNAYIAVKIKKGKSVIEGLYIGDKRIEDYIKNAENK